MPTGPLLIQMHAPIDECCLFGSVTDRRDFYHQAQISDARCRTNMLPFSYPVQEFGDSPAYAAFLERSKRIRRGREHAGDGFGVEINAIEQSGDCTELFPCFRSLFQGDHLGVEFALDSHQTLLRQEGLLDPSKRLFGSKCIPPGRCYEGLIIDDYFCIGVEKKKTKSGSSFAATALAQARAAYEKHVLEGSPEKDVVAERKFKAGGAEIDASENTLSLGLISVGSPFAKRLALSALSLRVAKMPAISRQLAFRLSGNWVSALLYRRCLSSIVDDFFALGSKGTDPTNENEILPLERGTAQELALLASFIPVMFSNIGVKFSGTFRATDSSLTRGVVVKTDIPVSLAKSLWEAADKKGGYTKLENPLRVLAKEVLEETEICEDLPQGPYKAPLLFFDFVEFYGGGRHRQQASQQNGLCCGTPIGFDSLRAL